VNENELHRERLQSFQSGRHGGRQPPVKDRTGEAGRLRTIEQEEVVPGSLSGKYFPFDKFYWEEVL